MWFRFVWQKVVVWGCRARESVLPRPGSKDKKSKRFFEGSEETSSTKINNESLEESFFFRVCEWRLNMRTREVKEKNVVTKFFMEFPMINEKFIGLRNKFCYLQVVDREASSISGYYHLIFTPLWIFVFVKKIWYVANDSVIWYYFEFMIRWIS